MQNPTTLKMNKLLIILLLFGVSILVLKAQTIPANLHEYSLTHYTDENGLPQNSVKSIYKSKSGYIWLITENGILRYDGNQFHTIMDSTNFTYGKRYTSFHVINSSEQEKLFTLSEDNKFSRVYHNYMIADNSIEKNLPEEFSIKFKDFVYRTLGSPNNFFKFHHPKKMHIPVAEEKNSYFILGNDSIYHYKDNSITYSLYFPDQNFWKAFRINNKLYLQQNDNTFLSFSKWGITPTIIKGDILKNPAYTKKNNLVIFWNNNNNQVFFSLNDVIYHVESEPDGTLNTSLLLSGFNISKQYINQIYYEKGQQRLFLGSIINGIYVLKKKRFKNLRMGDDGEENVYYGQVIYNDNSILTPQRIVLGYNPSTKEYTSTGLPELRKPRTWDRYLIIRDRNNYIWIKEGNNLLKYDSTGITHLETASPNAEINILHQENSGRVWVGTKYKGLYSFNPEDENIQFTHWTPSIKGSIMVIKNLNDHILMIGTSEGLFKYNILTKSLEELTYFRHKQVRNLYIPNENEIWINTYGQGSYLISDGRITKFPIDENGYLLNAHCIFEDRIGFFWVPTNKGLFRVAKNDLLTFAKTGNIENLWFGYFSKWDGFGTNEFNGGCQPCAVRLPNDFVSFPSLNGLVWFKPEEVESEYPRAPIFLDNISVNKGEYTLHGDTVQFNTSDIQAIVKISTPFFGDYYNLRFEYSFSRKNVNNPNTKWLNIDSKNSVIHLPQLGPGEYNLVVRKFSKSGIKNFDYKQFHLVVPTPWYESNWIYSLLGILFLLALYLIADLRSKYLQRKNLNLEKLVRKRTQELNSTLEELRHSQADLTWQSFINGQIIASISHDVKTPLKYLTNLTQSMYKTFEATKDPEMIEISKASHHTSKRLYYLLSNLLEYIKGNNLTDGYIQKESIAFRQLLNSKIHLFDETLAVNRSTVYNDVPEDFKLYSSPQLVGIIVQNLIDNAIKASPGGVVEISIKEKTSEKVVILFYNTGSVMSENLLLWFNEYKPNPYKNNKHNLLPKHNGLGLMIIKQLASLLEIEIMAYSDEKSGTSIYLTFQNHS